MEVQFVEIAELAEATKIQEPSKKPRYSGDLREGTYIIPKIMDDGYVELGKKRMSFARKG